LSLKGDFKGATKPRSINWRKGIGGRGATPQKRIGGEAVGGESPTMETSSSQTIKLEVLTKLDRRWVVGGGKSKGGRGQNRKNIGIGELKLVLRSAGGDVWDLSAREGQSIGARKNVLTIGSETCSRGRVDSSPALENPLFRVADLSSKT